MHSQLVKGGTITAVFVVWFYTYFQGITTAINIWSISEIFNHCFLVIPGAFFLIYQKRSALFAHPFSPNYWLLFPIVGTFILYTFGSVGDIRLFMHIAAFTSLPLIIWFFVGNQAAKVIAFPLYFIVFSIPFGEQFIPYLQQITTDLSVPLLEWTGIPVYRNGLYLEIPEGRFLVAEACSGISFLISSIVFGHVYAYLSFKSLRKKLIFIGVSLVLPIIANAIRVYGIVLIAHLTDMEHAAGADHLIYGGVFFAIVLFLLILVGERFRDKDKILASKNITDKNSNNENDISNQQRLSLSLLLSLFLIQNIWLSVVVNNEPSSLDKGLLINIKELPFSVNEEKLKEWRPDFSNASNTQQGYIQEHTSAGRVDFFIASYLGQDGELVSASNRLYSADRWSLIKSIKIDIGEQNPQLIKIVSPTGNYRYILYWYQLSNTVFTNKIKLKLYQTWLAMLGQTPKSAVFALSIESDQNIETVISTLAPKFSLMKNSFKGEL